MAEHENAERIVGMVKLCRVNRCAVLTVVAGVVGCVASQAVAQRALEELPGWERVRELAERGDRLVSGGRIANVQWSEDGASLTFERAGKAMRFDLIQRTLAEMPADANDEQSRAGGRATGGRVAGSGRVPRGQQAERERSPDEKRVAVCRDFNVVIEPVDGGETIVVTHDGNRKHRFGKASWVYGEELDQTSAMWWSPDSSRLAFYEFDEAEVPDYHLVRGWNELRTTPMVEGYPKPGDPNPVAKLMIYELATHKTIAVDVGEEREQYVFNVRFTQDGNELLFSRTNRRQDRLEVLAADVTTGKTRTVVTETQATYQENRPLMRFLEDGKRFIWETERSGFKHYELRHLDRSAMATLTSGAYPVDRIVQVDEKSGVLYYTAFSAICPLHGQFHRVNLDGSEPQRLTNEELHHEVQLSPDGKWFITTIEDVQTPPMTLLYETGVGRIATLAESDRLEFEDRGLTPPEMFSFKADDGVTDLYGVLYKPADFSPTKKYPLLVDVYGGPESQAVRSRYRAAYEWCELGFLVMKVDNRGTRGRGKAFEAAAYMKLGDVDMKDQADAVRYLATRPYVDASRVGIFGHSYGGYMAALAVLKFPDVFHVAVAGAPVTDWRLYDSIYTERFMRLPKENEVGYDAGSCIKLAPQLKGRLLIMHGMVDDNVHPSNAFQLIEALHAARKRVDMVMFPRDAHGLGPMSRNRRWEYLYQHLIDAPGAK